MDTRLAVLLVLIAVAVGLIGLVIWMRAAARHPLAAAPPSLTEREPSPYVALWLKCDRYRQQVAWRLYGRPGDGPHVGSSDGIEALGFAVALQSPGSIAKAAGALFQQTELLGKAFVRDHADPWMPDPEEWGAMLADWQIRARDYTELAHVDVGDPTGREGGDTAHRHSWSRTYTIRRRRTGGWLLEYGGNPSEIVVLPEGSVSAGGNQFRECEGCGNWESRDDNRGNWKADPYSGNAPSPRVQLLTQQSPTPPPDV